ncbi:hypothetical protein AB7813_03695 [Tardiphaga sp. 20_F10_N6_6]|uniref:hypothetical protein n=1 Tax=Tardiphaga sp. 20_F10_N6_6 TaxID=3240788 RepID=UPI003F8C6BC8
MKRHHLVALAWLALASPAMAAQGSGCMPTTGTVSGLSFSQAVNAAFQALISSNSGASPPATDCSAAPVKGQTWLDTSVTPNVAKQYDGTSWVVIGALDAANHLWSPPIGGGAASIAAATTTDICAAPSALQSITGTTTIAGFGSGCLVGVTKKLFFNSATPITYNAASMILPGQRDYVATPGDLAEALYLGAGNWRLAISKIDGSSVTNPAIPLGTALMGDYGFLPSKTVFGNGQALSRASYPDYFNAVTRAQTGTLTAGNNTITSVGSTIGLGAGMPIEGIGIQAGTTIVSFTSSTIVMSQTATANGTQTVRAFLTGYGTGGDSTTVGVKDCLGRMIAGFDPSSVRLLGATAVNSTQGNRTAFLTTPNLPPYTPAGSITNGAISAQFVIDGQANLTAKAGWNLGTGDSGSGTQFPNTAGTSGNLGAFFTQAASGFGGTAQGGTSTPFSIVPPMVTAECVVVVLP